MASVRSRRSRSACTWRTAKASHRAAELTRALLGFARRGKHQNVPVDVHGTIQEVILSRMDRLAQEAKEAMQLASVVGREFTVGEVRLRGVRLCEPCEHMEKLSGVAGIRKALAPVGGIGREEL